MNYLINRKK